MHPLRGLGADHVFNGRKRTEASLKQVMLSAAKQIGIGVGCLDGGCRHTLGYQLNKGFGETQRGVNGEGHWTGFWRYFTPTQIEQSSDPFDVRRTPVYALAQVAAPGTTDNVMVGVQNDDGVATIRVFVAVPTTDVPADKPSRITTSDDNNPFRNYVVSYCTRKPASSNLYLSLYSLSVPRQHRLYRLA